MTVRELIELLETQDPDLEVCTPRGDMDDLCPVDSAVEHLEDWVGPGKVLVIS